MSNQQTLSQKDREKKQFVFEIKSYSEMALAEIKPQDLHLDYYQVVMKKIYRKYANKVIQERGLVRDIKNIKMSRDGEISVNGNVKIRVKMELSIISLPKKEEIFEAVIISVTHSGYYLYPSVFKIEERLPLEIFILKEKNEKAMTVGEKMLVSVATCKYTASQYNALVKRSLLSV